MIVELVLVLEFVLALSPICWYFGCHNWVLWFSAKAFADMIIPATLL